MSQCVGNVSQSMSQQPEQQDALDSPEQKKRRSVMQSVTRPARLLYTDAIERLQHPDEEDVDVPPMSEERRRRLEEDQARDKANRAREKQRRRAQLVRPPQFTDQMRDNGLVRECVLGRDWRRTEENKKEFAWIGMMRTCYLTTGPYRNKETLASEGNKDGTHMREMAFGWISADGKESMEYFYFFSTELPTLYDANKEKATRREPL
jgi:hypothetical protein